RLGGQALVLCGARPLLDNLQLPDRVGSDRSSKRMSCGPSKTVPCIWNLLFSACVFIKLSTQRQGAIVIPPSTVRACPTTQLAPGLQSHNTTDAISSGLPARPIGTFFAISAYACSSPLTTSLAICVSIRPGLTAFTRMPCLMYSRASCQADDSVLRRDIGTDAWIAG